MCPTAPSSLYRSQNRYEILEWIWLILSEKSFMLCGALFSLGGTLAYKLDVGTCNFFCVSKVSRTAGVCKGKGKAAPLQAWTDPEVTRRLRLPEFKIIGT